MRETEKPTLFVASRVETRRGQKQMDTDGLSLPTHGNRVNFCAIQFYSVAHRIAKLRRKPEEFCLLGVHNLVSFILPKYKFKLYFLIFPFVYCVI